MYVWYYSAPSNGEKLYYNAQAEVFYDRVEDATQYATLSQLLHGMARFYLSRGHNKDYLVTDRSGVLKVERKMVEVVETEDLI